jgi:hypothetical protein
MTIAQEIKDAVHEAAHESQKTVMFHFQILKNASKLDGVDPVKFCREISVPDSYHTEFRKMISLSRLMRDEGILLVRPL